MYNVIKTAVRLIMLPFIFVSMICIWPLIALIMVVECKDYDDFKYHMADFWDMALLRN